MRKVILSLLLALPACAQLPPLPAAPVKRVTVLQSPRAASVLPSTPMYIPPSGNPYLPMGWAYFPTPGDPFGDHEFHASALQPANQAVTFELSIDGMATWTPLAFYGPYPVEQWVTTAFGSSRTTDFVRARASGPETPPPAILSESAPLVLRAESGAALMSRRAPQKILTNPKFKVRTSTRGR